MKYSFILTITLIFSFTKITWAVGEYNTPCESEKKNEDKSFSELKKCFEKTFKESANADISEKCSEHYKKAAQLFQSSRLCQKQASLLK